MKQLIFTFTFLCIFGKLYSQNIIGKWSMIECEIRESKIKIPVTSKKDKVVLTLNSDKSYIKEFYQYNTFDNFGSEMTEVNTMTDKLKKLPNKKVKVKGAYLFDGKESLSLIRDNKTIEYKIFFEGEKLVVINKINESFGSIITIYQRFEKIK